MIHARQNRHGGLLHSLLVLPDEWSSNAYQAGCSIPLILCNRLRVAYRAANLGANRGANQGERKISIFELEFPKRLALAPCTTLKIATCG